MAMTPEAKVKSDVQRYLHEKGFIRAGSAPKSWPDPVQGWYFMPSQNGRGVTGIPDFVGCYKGRFFSRWRPRRRVSATAPTRTRISASRKFNVLTA